MRKTGLIIVVFCFIFVSVPAQLNDSSYHEKMEWFKDAKLGIFIHWGIYSVYGIDESWSFFNNYISHDDYLKQLDRFYSRSLRSGLLGGID
ncbi:MAG: alpha-L-fucosidase [Bacteroidales bacterium]|nr:alpha-L-fucosidase [Bacteroidales bacterium]